MFLERLLDRALAPPAIENALSAAAELDHPAWGQVTPEPVDESAMVEEEAAERPTQPSRPRAVRQTRAAAPDPPVTPTEPADFFPETAAPWPPPAAARHEPQPSGDFPAAARPEFPRAFRAANPVTTGPGPSVPPLAQQQAGPVPTPSFILPPLSHATPASPRAAPVPAAQVQKAETVEIHLEIGRIDLVGALPAGPAPRPGPSSSPAARPGPLLSLGDYLAARRGELG